MARRAKSSTKESTAAQETAPAEIAEPVAVKAARRGTKAKMREAAPAELSVTDTFFPGEEPVADADPVPPPAAKTRRTRKQDPQPAPKLETQQESTATPAAPPSTTEEASSPVTSSTAARWEPDTGTATFDWSAIEEVAATTGPNQAMAKLLLAARAEGANSRWPF